jgi:hypothetical protein
MLDANNSAVIQFCFSARATARSRSEAVTEFTVIILVGIAFMMLIVGKAIVSCGLRWKSGWRVVVDSRG